MDDMDSIFLAHSSRDKAFVRRLTRDLETHGVTVWLDEAELLVGDSLIDRIQTAITGMTYVGAVISTHSVQSAWVQKELELALSLELRDRQVRVLPILLDECAMPPFLMGKVYADFRQPHDYDLALRRLLHRLVASPEPVRDYLQATVEERVEALRTAEMVIAEMSPRVHNLTNSAVTLFALLDGGFVYLGRPDCLRLGSLFGAFADIYPPAADLLATIAEHGENSDHVIAGAIFGLSLTRGSAGQQAFRRVLASPNIDTFDKRFALDRILHYSRVSLRDFPAGFVEMINEHALKGAELIQDDYVSLKRIDPLESYDQPVVRPEWVEVIKASRELMNPHYRGTASEADNVAMKRARITLAQATIQTRDA